MQYMFCNLVVTKMRNLIKTYDILWRNCVKNKKYLKNCIFGTTMQSVS